MANPVITVEPSVEPLTRAEAKAFILYEDTIQDDLVDTLITAARAEVERRIRRQLITATYEWKLDDFPYNSGPLYIPRPPLQSISSLAYTDTAGDAQTLTENTDFIVDIHNEPGRITPAYGTVWPNTYSEINVVTVTYNAGYGDDAADVPAQLKVAMRWIISAAFDIRPGVVEFKLYDLETRLNFLLTPFVIPEFA